MKHLLNQFNLVSKRFDQRHIQLAFIIVTLLMLAIGAGAPFGHGGH